MRAAIMKEQGLLKNTELESQPVIQDMCDSKSHGGHRHGKSRDTLKAVAEEVGLNSQTLHNRLKAVEPDVGVIDLEADSPAEHHACGNHEGAGTYPREQLSECF
jgi:hypothetical protein